MSREYTNKEIVEELIEGIKNSIAYWVDRTDKTNEEIIEGATHSVLCIFDGITSLPAFNISVSPHPDDKQYNIDNGDNYYPENKIINDDIYMHDLVFKR